MNIFFIYTVPTENVPQQDSMMRLIAVENTCEDDQRREVKALNETPDGFCLSFFPQHKMPRFLNFTSIIFSADLKVF
jgi:hypothetical protein